jgi:predicted phosphoribosyltransferase
MFRDRHDAGEKLATALRPLRDDDPLVVGLARGGVVVGYEVARALHAPLDVMVARKIGAPGHEELAIGAIAPGVVYVDSGLAHITGADREYIETAARAQRQVMEERERRYRAERPPPELRNRSVILVDDGLATGLTAMAAVASVRQDQPKKIIVAAPVGSPEAAARLRRVADEVVCLYEPPDFRAVGFYYLAFGDTSDQEVSECLGHSRHSRVGASPLLRRFG